MQLKGGNDNAAQFQSLNSLLDWPGSDEIYHEHSLNSISLTYSLNHRLRFKFLTALEVTKAMDGESSQLNETPDQYTPYIKYSTGNLELTKGFSNVDNVFSGLI